MGLRTLTVFALAVCVPVFASFHPTECKDTKCYKVGDKTTVEVISGSKERWAICSFLLFGYPNNAEAVFWHVSFEGITAKHSESNPKCLALANACVKNRSNALLHIFQKGPSFNHKMDSFGTSTKSAS